MPEDTWYSVVINNPTPQDESALKEARARGWLIEGQLEKGKNGTPHYQLAVRTDEGWSAIKQMLPRANIQEAEDPVALRRYVVKTETRLLDLVPPTRQPRCPPRKLTNVEFFDGLFCTMWDSATTSGLTQTRESLLQSISADSSMTHYDRAVEHWMGDASTPQFAMELGTRAIRPDVRAIYRRYRLGIAKMWTPPDDTIDLPMNIQDADDHTDFKQDAGGSVGEEHDDTEAEEGSEGEGTDDETEGSGEGSSEGTSGDEVCE